VILFAKIIVFIGVKQIVNHFEFHKELTTKNRLLETMKSYFEGQKRNVFEYMPLSFYVEVNLAKPNLKFQALSEFYSVFNALGASKKVIKKVIMEKDNSIEIIESAKKTEISKLMVI
jgi:hypothetical protein